MTTFHLRFVASVLIGFVGFGCRATAQGAAPSMRLFPVSVTCEALAGKTGAKA